MGPIQAAVGLVTAPLRLLPGRALPPEATIEYDEDANTAVVPQQYADKAEHWPEVDPKDAKTPDAEAPLPELLSHGFISPQNLHIVRNHGAVPRLEWDTHRVEVKGNVRRRLSLSMDEIASMKSITFPCLVTCAGNR
eukprot:jgi/Tetstr1/420321/TSEL_011442.t1